MNLKEQENSVGFDPDDCSTWTATDWEGHLKSFEKDQTEILLADPMGVEELGFQDFKEGVIGMISEDAFSGFISVVEVLVKRLTPRQRDVIFMLFWERKSLREVASIFDIQKTSVQRARDRALANLQKVLKKIAEIQSRKKKLDHTVENETKTTQPQEVSA